jgi:hypothetical protein
MSQVSKIETAREFKTLVVDPDYRDYKANPLDLRRAYHLALGLFHLRDWTFWQYKDTPTWPYPKNRNRYQEELERQCDAFGYIRDLANAVKHAELEKPSTSMVGLACTEISKGAFDRAAFDPNVFHTSRIVSNVTSAPIDFERSADAVMALWDRIFASNGWGCQPPLSDHKCSGTA